MSYPWTIHDGCFRRVPQRASLRKADDAIGRREERVRLHLCPAHASFQVPDSTGSKIAQNIAQNGFLKRTYTTLIAYTGLSKRNGAKLRESFSLATAGHARLVLSKTVPFFCTTLYCQHQKGEKNGQENHPKNRPNYYFLLNSLPGLGRARDRFRR